MNDPDTARPLTDEEIRARLQAFARGVAERADTEAALDRLQRRSMSGTARLLAVAACTLAVVALALAVAAERQSVRTSGPLDRPTSTVECPSATQPRAITQGAPMNKRFTATLASAATAVVLFGGCSDDSDATADTPSTEGPTVIAKGTDIELVGDGEGIESQTLNIDVEETDGNVTGELRVTDNLTAIECADTSHDGTVIIGGSAVQGSAVSKGQLYALVIREGDPDSVALVGNGEIRATTCEELVSSVSDDLGTAPADDQRFTPLEAGSDIETS